MLITEFTPLGLHLWALHKMLGHLYFSGKIGTGKLLTQLRIFPQIKNALLQRALTTLHRLSSSDLVKFSKIKES